MSVGNWARAKRAVSDLLGQTQLCLEKYSVYTEAATNAYSIGPAIAIMAGAETVHCVARESQFGSSMRALEETVHCLEEFGCDRRRMTCSEGHSSTALGRADIVTNSGMLRPLDQAVIRHMRRGSVISLMYAPWEFRERDIDLEVARECGISVVGVNENHPTVGIYAATASLALRGLFEGGLGAFSNDLLLICANPFAPDLVRGLSPHCRMLNIVDQGSAGIQLPHNVVRISETACNPRHYDALVIFDVASAERWAVASTEPSKWPRGCLGTWDVCVQCLGDIRREDFPDVSFIPALAPHRGQQGINPGELGIDLVARLIIAGLSAGAEMRTHLCRSDGAAVNWNAMEWSLPLHDDYLR